jgi:hypothetical protein
MQRSARRSLAAVVGVAAGALFLSGIASATHDVPAKAKAISAELVRSYDDCTAPDTSTIAFPVPACSTVTALDSMCSFGAKGAGKVKAQSTGKGDVKFSWQVGGLDPGCEGFTLCPNASVRVTTDDCPGGDCTTLDLPFFPLAGSPATGCGVVVGGKAKGKGTVNGTYGSAITLGDGQSIELLGCGVRRIDGPALPAGNSFSCGVLAP